MSKKTDQTVEIGICLTEDQALAFAQLLKRLGTSHYEALAANTHEAQQMSEAGFLLRKAFAEKGYDPR